MLEDSHQLGRAIPFGRYRDAGDRGGFLYATFEREIEGSRVIIMNKKKGKKGTLPRECREKKWTFLHLHVLLP